MAGLMHPPLIFPEIEQAANKAIETIKVDMELSVVNLAFLSPMVD